MWKNSVFGQKALFSQVFKITSSACKKMLTNSSSNFCSSFVSTQQRQNIDMLCPSFWAKKILKRILSLKLTVDFLCPHNYCCYCCRVFKMYGTTALSFEWLERQNWDLVNILVLWYTIVLPNFWLNIIGWLYLLSFNRYTK